MEYILITPIKDEEEYLTQLLDTVVNQHVKPLVWVVVDNSEEDNSFQVAKQLFEAYSWIYVIKLREFLERGYSDKNFAQAINEGYKYAKRTCVEKGINYSFIGKTDATPILAEDYFQLLLSEMEQDPSLAFTCGIEHLLYKGKKTIIKPRYGIPLTGVNDIRLYRREFFEEVGGYPFTTSSDTSLLFKAVNRGWKVKVVENAHYIKPRLQASKIGVWQGNKLKGKTSYEMGQHPLLALMTMVEEGYRTPPHYQVIPQMWGYFLSAIRNEKRTDYNEMREYYSRERLREIVNALLRRGGR